MRRIERLRLRLKGHGLPDAEAKQGLLRRGSDPGANVSDTGREAALRGASRAFYVQPEGPAMTIERRYPLARPFRLSPDSYARLTGVHPDLVRRFIALGLLEMIGTLQGGLWFEPSQVSAMARIQRDCMEN